ncbi:MAG: CPBP family intramembrane glutamic endopeptidase [Terriglobia bacterium]
MNERSPESPSQLSTPEPLYPLPSEPQRRPKALERFIAKAFVGRGGIRAGWRLAIFLAIVVAFIAGLSFIARTFFHVKPPTGPLEPLSLLHDEGVAFLVILFASWVMSRIEHRRIADYGLPVRRAFRSQFWLGILFGFAAITVLLGSMRLAGVFRFGTIGLHGFEAYEYALQWGLAFLFVGLFEEFFFRGYALFTLTTGMTFWPSAILLSTFFGLIHRGTPGESWIGAAEAGATGLLFCLLLRRTGDLWMPIGFHAAWNWGQTYFYGVSDSGLAAKGHLFNPTFSGPAWLTGGSVGPEGSLLSIAVLVVLWSIFALWLREKKYPNQETTCAGQS